MFRNDFRRGADTRSLARYLASHSSDITGVCSLKALLADWKLVLAMGGAAIAALAMIAYAFFRPAVDPEEAERKRRLHLNQIGRIAEGQVVELVEHPPEAKEARKRLFGGSARPLEARRP